MEMKFKVRKRWSAIFLVAITIALTFAHARSTESQNTVIEQASRGPTTGKLPPP
jgi:hypothetical protein